MFFRQAEEEEEELEKKLTEQERDRLVAHLSTIARRDERIGRLGEIPPGTSVRLALIRPCYLLMAEAVVSAKYDAEVYVTLCKEERVSLSPGHPCLVRL